MRVIVIPAESGQFCQAVTLTGEAEIAAFTGSPARQATYSGDARVWVNGDGDGWLPRNERVTSDGFGRSHDVRWIGTGRGRPPQWLHGTAVITGAGDPPGDAPAWLYPVFGLRAPAGTLPGTAPGRGISPATGQVPPTGHTPADLTPAGPREWAYSRPDGTPLLFSVGKTDERARFAAGLHALADYIAANPGVPVPVDGRHTITVFASGTDEQQFSQVDTAAGMLGQLPAKPVTGGHYKAERSFGPVTYQFAAIPAQVRARAAAVMSYAGAVVPDPPAEPAVCEASRLAATAFPARKAGTPLAGPAQAFSRWRAGRLQRAQARQAGGPR